jgi:hypothetical protein
MIDHKKLDNILTMIDAGPSTCSDCFNQFHCSLGCPDVCPFDDQFHPDIRPDCIKEKWLGLAGLLELSGHLTPFASESDFLDFFHRISSQRM